MNRTAPASTTDEEDLEASDLPKEPTPLPLMPLFVLCCIVLSESFSITMIFPFIADMVRDFGYEEADIGFYAGWIASSFNIAQFISSFGWGRLSDTIGRRPVLLVGLSGNLLMIFLFGWSTTLWFAILARSLNGFLNGNIGVVKTYLAEITDDSNAAKGFSVFGFVWGFGLVLGPAIGGFLSNPHEIAPIIFPPGSLFYHYPYLLPCIASALVTAVGAVTGYFFLPETLPNAGCMPAEEEKPLTPTTPMSSEDDVWYKIILKLFKTKEVVIATLLYAILCFTTMIFDEVYAIWATYGEEFGGIGFTNLDLGWSYIIAGVSLLISQILVFPWIVGKLGPLRLYRLSALIITVLLPIYPTAGLLINKPRWQVWLVIGTFMFVRNFALNWAFTASMLLVNNSAEPYLLGATNGFAQSAASFLRAAAPTIGGTMLAWSLKNGLGFPFNQYFSFEFIGFFSLVTFGLTFVVDRNVMDFRKTLPTSTDDDDQPKYNDGEISLDKRSSTGGWSLGH